MTDQNDSHRGIRLLIIAATLVIILWGINQAQSVVALFLVSAFLAVIGTVPVLWMERNRIPTVVAVLIVVAAMVTLLLGIGVVVGASLNDFSKSLPSYQTRIHDMLFALKALLARKGIAVTDEILLGYINPAAVMNMTAAMLTSLSSVFSNVVVILFTVMFILLEASSFPVKVRSVLDNPQAAFPQVTGFVREIKRYMVLKTLINLIVGALTTMWLFILGVDYPVLWGFLAFLLHFVPNIGTMVAGVPAVLLALVQLGWGSAVLTAAGYLVIGMVVGNIVEPKIMGRTLGLSTLVIFLSLIVWGSLLGVIGALLCVPLTMTLKLACEESENTRWIGVLLGHERSAEGIPAAVKRWKQRRHRS
jgi:predicted PurR-regulated permease PerM